MPLVYCLHVGFLGLAIALSLVHKYFTLKASVLVYLGVKITEILLFYYYSLYLQDNECLFLSTAVHYVFDFTVYNLLLDFMHSVTLSEKEFRFEVGRRNPKEDIRAKLIFNITLLAISYISSLQFQSVFVGFFFYIHVLFLVLRLFQLCVRATQP